MCVCLYMSKSIFGSWFFHRLSGTKVMSQVWQEVHSLTESSRRFYLNILTSTKIRSVILKAFFYYFNRPDCLNIDFLKKAKHASFFRMIMLDIRF